MHGMKMIEHLGSFEVRYDNSPLPWMHPAVALGIAAAGAGLAASAKMWTPSRLTFT